MRKTFTLAICIFIFSSINAQIKKGSLLLGGDIGGSASQTKSADTVYAEQNQIVITPVFGKAIKDNLVFGVSAGITLYNTDKPNSFTTENDIYNAGIFLRKYKFIGNSGFSIFVEGDLGYNYNHSKSGSSSAPPVYKTTRQTVYINAYPGLSYTISKKLQLESGFNRFLYLNYWNEKLVQEGTVVNTFKTNGISVGSSLNNISNLYLGFRLLIGK